MCQAIVKPEGLRVPEETLRNAWRDNTDGAGFAVLQDGQVTIYKGYFKFRKFYKAYRKFEKYPCLIHFRYATHGVHDAENCHPFKVSDDTAMIHNGILSKFLPSALEKRSDTRVLVEEHITPCVVRSGLTAYEFLNNEGVRYLIEGLIPGNKLAFLSPSGFTIYNERLGQWKDGIWYSAGFPSAYDYGYLDRIACGRPLSIATRYADATRFDGTDQFALNDDEEWLSQWEKWEDEAEAGAEATLGDVCILCEQSSDRLYQIGADKLCVECWHDYTSKQSC